MTFSIELLDFFAKAGIQCRQGEKRDHHCDKNQIIHKTFRRALRLCESSGAWFFGQVPANHFLLFPSPSAIYASCSAIDHTSQ
jgi:hypothetical protein